MRRPLPFNAATALEIIVASGSRSMGRNEFELRMHQRGLKSRDVIEAIKAFKRRGWIVSASSQITVSDDAAPLAQTPKARLKRTRRIPNLFS